MFSVEYDWCNKMQNLGLHELKSLILSEFDKFNVITIQSFNKSNLESGRIWNIYEKEMNARPMKNSVYERNNNKNIKHSFKMFLSRELPCSVQHSQCDVSLNLLVPFLY